MKDILHEALPLAGAERVFWRVRLKPGSPLMFSLLNGIPVLSLSGNPFAASATFELFGAALLQRLAGAEDLEMQTFYAVLDEGYKKTRGAPRFVRGIVKNGHVTLPKGHSSGQLASAAGANCLVEIRPSARRWSPEARFRCIFCEVTHERRFWTRYWTTSASPSRTDATCGAYTVCRMRVVEWMPHDRILRYEDILRLCRIFVELGITNSSSPAGTAGEKGSRLSGGGLRAIPGTQSVTLTTKRGPACGHAP